MDTSRLARAALFTVATCTIGILALAGCTSSAGSPAPTTTAVRDGKTLGAAVPAPPMGEVVGTGTVMDVDGAVEFCMGAVAESYPPQCNGIPVVGWSWEGVEGNETSGSTRWGAYALIGIYDGETFTPTQDPMMLALYDPMAPETPVDQGPGDTDEATLIEIQDELPGLLGDDGSQYLSSMPVEGRLIVDVVWDDGTLQQAADDDYGTDVVVIRSALRLVEG